MKICPKCKIIKQTNEFRNNKRNKDGKTTYCKDCLYVIMKTYRQNNLAKVALRRSKWRKSNPNIEKIACKKWRTKYYKNFSNYLHRLLKHTNKSKQHICTITHKYLIDLLLQQDYKCAISKVELLHEKRNLQSVSIDRIDSSKGYIEGNIQLVCRTMNLAKNNYSNSEMLNFIELIKKA